MRSKFWRNCVGFTMVELLIGLALVSTLAAGSMALFQNLFRSARFTEIKGEISTQKNKVMTQISCARTRNQCLSAGGFIPVLNTDDAEVVPNSGAAGTRLGSVFLRARCTGPNAFQIQRKLATEAAEGVDFTKSMGHGWRPLFPLGTDPCGPAIPDRILRCAGGQVMRGFNLDTGDPECAAGQVQCPAGKHMKGFNLVTGNPICVSPPALARGLVECSAGKVMRGINLTTGTPKCVTPPPPSTAGPSMTNINCPAGTMLKGFNLNTGQAQCVSPKVEVGSCEVINPGPYDHCRCPTGQVMTMFNGDLPAPPGMLFQATCMCCDVVVTAP